MKKTLFAVLVLAAAVAFGATRRKANAGGLPPSSCNGAVQSSAWVRLDNAEGCRMSVVTDAGALAAQGKLVPWYCQLDSDGTVRVRPMESAPGSHCTIATRLDGGGRTDYVCADLEPLASFGFVAAVGYGVSNHDGGAANFHTIMECWGPLVTGP